MSKVLNIYETKEEYEKCPQVVKHINKLKKVRE